ncbi:MAG TPA: transposase [Gemmatimonadales bacterium]|nr:transposase [Gemmatimonadales bacterium]
MPNLEDLCAAELRSLVVSLLGTVAELEAKVAALTEEIARLKRLKGRPNLKPSGMEKGTDPPPAPSGGTGRPKRRDPPKSARLIVDEDRVVPLAPQPGWRCKGFKFYTVQDLVVETRVVRYWRPCYRTPEGRLVIAPLPPEVTGHFGANLVRFLLSQHYQCRVTMPLLHQQLQDVGIVISSGQISNLLTKGHEAFHTEKAAVKQAGLETARWISVDDTGARHLGINGVTTQIGDDRFTSFDTVAGKSRLMFLMTLRGAFQDYVLNPAALLYLHEQDAPEALINRLIEPDDRVFADEDVWTDHLIALGITGAKAVRLASEAAVAGSLDHHGLLPDAVIVSDGAGQFDVLRHSLCWIHAERLIHRLVTVTEEQRAAVALVRHLIWWFYRDLKLYRTDPSARARASLKARFDRIFTRTTGFAELDELLARLRLRKAELLVTLERPEVPLNTNSSERDVRDPVTIRKISGGTRSDGGRRCRDTFLSLTTTCQKNAISFWDYLGDRLGSVTKTIRHLPDIIRERAAHPPA